MLQMVAKTHNRFETQNTIQTSGFRFHQDPGHAEVTNFQEEKG
jgi:hypothetical protein